MEIREVTYGRDGLILVRKEYKQKFNLVSRESKVDIGDIVTAELVKGMDKENYAIYYCTKIHPSRMILKLRATFSIYKHTALWNGEEFKFTAHISSIYFECQTEIFSRRAGGFKILALIKNGLENSVLEYIKQAERSHSLA